MNRAGRALVPAQHPADADPGPTRCLVCHGPTWLWRSHDQVSDDLDAAARWHARRRPRAAGHRSGALKDSAELMYGHPAPIWQCLRCNSLYRDPTTIPADIADRYRDDPYPPDTLTRLWDRYTASYSADPWLRRHLPDQRGRMSDQARFSLLEIGSHVGALLAYATTRGWTATGVDVGADVTAYARSRGVDAHQRPFDVGDYEPESFDTVCILNCFEHLPDPRRVLHDVLRILRPGGRVLIRTPRADGIVALHSAAPRRVAQAVLVADNSLGVPFPRCYSEGALIGLLTSTGFRRIQVRRRRLVSVAPRPARRVDRCRCLAEATTTQAVLAFWSLAARDRRTWMDAAATKPLHQP